MATYLAGMSQQEPRATIENLVRGFDRDAVASARQMRAMRDNDGPSFLSGAAGVLKDYNGTAGHQSLLSLLAAGGLLGPVLSDPSLSLKQAVELARAAARMDSKVDVALAKQLADSVAGSGDSTLPIDASRLLEILGEISDGTRILAPMARLLRSSNPHLRSKVILLMGRGNRSARWLQTHLAADDPRVRASAVEALWGVDTEEARELLEAAARDPHNRVAGNAILALHRLGDCSVIPQVSAMARHEAIPFRLTAAWVMGETRDPRFLELLAGMLRDADAAVRTRAFTAIGQIKAAVARSRQAGQWRAGGLFLEGETPGWRRLQLAVNAEDPRERLRCAPTQFILSEGGQAITAYRVVERIAAEAMSLVLVFPRSSLPGGAPWNHAMEKCLEAKRPSDRWALAPYLASGKAAESLGKDSMPLSFTAKPPLIEALFKVPANRTDCTDFSSALWRAVRADQGPSRGRRHLIVVNETDAGWPAEFEDLVAAARKSRATVQVVSVCPSPALEELCRLVAGSFQIASGGEVGDRVEQAYLNLLARYEVHYQSPAPDARLLRVKVHTPDGWAEATVQIPPL
ncbi:MAG: HEAT repeat domain-containing protein [Acidobacteriia bacterium]|nr:HEAT repeat domain-containing protein [Terriglobia bacterium]